MKEKIKVGDKVKVMDRGLLLLRNFAPPGAKPNNEGVVKEIFEDGDLLIEFPVNEGGDNEHSQVAPYPADICIKIK